VCTPSSITNIIIRASAICRANFSLLGWDYRQPHPLEATAKSLKPPQWQTQAEW